MYICFACILQVQTLLDDHLIRTQSMKGSVYARPFEAKINSWEEWLMTAQELMELWLKVQSAWMYLEPVFGAEDIMNQMPGEGQMFTVVNQHWHKLMKEVNTLLITLS